MRGFFQSLVIILWIIFAAESCSRQSTSVLSRTYHATTAEYNILFHSKENLQKGLEELRKKKESDFYAELPLEGIEFDDKIYLPGQSRSNYISLAEEKAVKAVQKHSMEIRGSEFNPKMDEAMLLLGMSRYYDQRYLSALDAFNYALDTYYDTDLRQELLLWRAKSLLKLGNTLLARKKLKSIAFGPETRPDTRAWAYAFISETYRDDGLNDTVASYLTMGARVAKDKNLRQTLAYKAAQVWEQLNRRDSALAMTDFILKSRTPENFILHTLLYRMHLTKEDTATHDKNLKLIRRYLNNYYYNRYFPDLHYRLAEIAEVRRDTDTAVVHYGLAARSPNKTLKRLAYNHLADIYWNRKNYLFTGKYLDSMLTVMDKNKLDYLLVSQRRRSIDQIVKWEEIIRRNDSILHFIQLDSLTQRKKIEARIARIKQRQASSTVTDRQSEAQTGSFYFYNSAQVEKGKQRFKEIWGNRPLQDMWRLGNAQTSGGIRPDAPGIEPADTETQPQDTLTVERFLAQLPRTSHEIDSIRQLLIKARLMLGANYANDKFREYELAERHIRKALQSGADPNQQAQAYYLLYKIYKATGRNESARNMSEKLRKEFPDTPYTQYILHPETATASTSERFAQDFKHIYGLYKEGKWDEALQTAEQALRRHREHPDAPKLMFLEAKIKGKSQGIDAYIETLTRIQKLYPDTPYENAAKEQLKKLRYLKAKYSVRKDEFPYLLVHVIRDSSDATRLQQCLRDIYRKKETQSKHFFVDRYNKDTLFLVSGDYLSRESADYVLEELQKDPRCTVPPSFIISKQNYINLQLTKGKLPLP